MSPPKFRVGQRVRLSPLGLERNLVPKTRLHQSGIVVKVDEFNCPKVVWDGRKTPRGYYHGFIAIDRRRRAP